MSDIPYLASIEITRRCDNDCPYCARPKADADMSVSRFSEWLDKLVSTDFKAVATGGGEPTLHPELPTLLKQARKRGLMAGLTTNAHDPEKVLSLADDGLLYTFGVSAGKGHWQKLISHPKAIVNILMLHNGLDTVTNHAMQAIRRGAGQLLLLGYKGTEKDFKPTTAELSEAFTLLTFMGHRCGVSVAADDYTRRRLDLIQECGRGFLYIDMEGRTDKCCFEDCEYRKRP